MDHIDNGCNDGCCELTLKRDRDGFDMPRFVKEKVCVHPSFGDAVWIEQSPQNHAPDKVRGTDEKDDIMKMVYSCEHIAGCDSRYCVHVDVHGNMVDCVFLIVLEDNR